MTVTVNDESRSVADSVTLQDLIQSLQLHERTGIAVAVNDSVITRSVWPSCRLQENDGVTIIQATQGG